MLEHLMDSLAPPPAHRTPPRNRTTSTRTAGTRPTTTRAAGTHRTGGRSAVIALAAVFALVLAACSSDGEGVDQFVDDTATTASSITSATTTSPSSTSDDGSSSSNTTVDGSTTATSPSTLPGEPFEGFAQAGDVLMVVGVAADDQLNVRTAPGTDHSPVAELDPTQTDVIATGRARSLTRSIWYEVTVEGVTGWANSSFLAFGGVVDDVTSAIIDSLGERPVAETMLELGEIVAEDRSSADVESRIVVSVAPTVGDLGEVTYDVMGLADDSVYGFRLHVFGQPDESGEGFGLAAVEQTALCGRGVDEVGRCA